MFKNHSNNNLAYMGMLCVSCFLSGCLLIISLLLLIFPTQLKLYYVVMGDVTILGIIMCIVYFLIIIVVIFFTIYITIMKNYKLWKIAIFYLYSTFFIVMFILTLSGIIKDDKAFLNAWYTDDGVTQSYTITNFNYVSAALYGSVFASSIVFFSLKLSGKKS
jgi:hypothetical protein